MYNSEYRHCMLHELITPWDHGEHCHGGWGIVLMGSAAWTQLEIKLPDISEAKVDDRKFSTEVISSSWNKYLGDKNTQKVRIWRGGKWPDSKMDQKWHVVINLRHIKLYWYWGNWTVTLKCPVEYYEDNVQAAVAPLHSPKSFVHWGGALKIIEIYATLVLDMNSMGCIRTP